MSSRVFVIADLHFGHKKLAALRGFSSVDEHDGALIDAWNATVTKRDVVYVLGDVFDSSLLRITHGIKKLAMGNHDHDKMIQYTSIFSKVRAMFEYDGCILSHIPVHPSQFPRYELNVHGHTHEHSVKHREGIPDLRYIPTSVEHSFAPRLLNELIAERRAKTLKAETIMQSWEEIP